LKQRGRSVPSSEMIVGKSISVTFGAQNLHASI
jgi:hypothetical protein